MVAGAIIAADVRGAANRIRRRRAGGLILLAALGGLVLALGAVFGGGLALGGFRQTVGAPAVDSILGLAFTALGVVMLVFGFSTVVSAFYADRDLLLLATAPVPPGQIFLARLARSAWANSLTGSMLLSALAGFGLASGFGAAFVGTAALLVLAEVVALTSLQVALLALVVRSVPARRIKDVANIVSAFAATTFYIGWLALRAPGTGLNGRHETLASGLRGFAQAGERVAGFPTTWPARALAEWGSPQTSFWVALTVGLALVVSAAAYALFRVTFLAGLAAFLETGRGRRQTASVIAGRDRGVSPTAAIVRKDWITLRRDGRRLVRLLPGAVLAFAYPLLFFRSANSGGVWVIGFVPWFLAQIFGLPSVAAERRGFHLLRLAAVSPLQLLWAKTLAAAVPVVGLSFLAAVLIVLVQGIPPESPLVITSTLWLAIGLTLISVGAGAISPRLDVDDPRRSVGFEGVLVGLAGGAVFGALSIAGFGGLDLAATLAARGQSAFATPWLGLVPAWVAVGSALLIVMAALPPVAILIAGARSLAVREP